MQLIWPKMAIFDASLQSLDQGERGIPILPGATGDMAVAVILYTMTKGRRYIRFFWTKDEFYFVLEGEVLVCYTCELNRKIYWPYMQAPAVDVVEIMF